MLIAAWFLWGTGMVTARSQERLTSEFEERLVAVGDATGQVVPDLPETRSEIPTTPAWDDPSIRVEIVASDEPNLDGVVREPAPLPGQPLGRIVIPKIEVDWMVVEGITPKDLSLGPGHVIGSALPGQVGNSVISGHRTTYGSPFSHLDLLERGDRISVATIIGAHTYEVVETREILPTDIWIATQWEGGWLTLTTCTPRYFSTHRLIVIAQLISGPNAAPIHAYFGPPIDLPSR